MGLMSVVDGFLCGKVLLAVCFVRRKVGGADFCRREMESVQFWERRAGSVRTICDGGRGCR
jgi:hypothetical protein